jgi:hypothetical protein
MSLGNKDEKGYLFSVDLHIPEELHNYMNNYPKNSYQETNSKNRQAGLTPTPIDTLFKNRTTDPIEFSIPFSSCVTPSNASIEQYGLGYNIGFVKYIEDCRTGDEEHLVVENFMNNVKHNRGIDNGFGPNLSYRKYFLNKLKNKYTTDNNIHIDLNIFYRIFDMNISFNKNPLSIALEVNKIYDNPNIILGSSELFIIGSNKSFDYFFNLSELFKAGKVYHDDIWDNIHFSYFIIILIVV